MFQAPKNSKSEFSQLPSFGQIANTPLQAGNPSSSSSNLSSTSPFTTMATFPGTTSQMESSSFRNPSAFSTSSFTPKSGSVLFSNQTKSTTSVGVSQPSNLFASATTSNPLAGIFSTGTTHPTSFSSSQASSSSFTSSTSSGSYPTPFTPSNAFGNSSRTENISSLPNNFGGGASSSPRSKSVFGHSSTTAPSVKSNLFVPSDIGLFAPTSDGTNARAQAPFTMNRFETSSKGLVFSSQLTHPKSAVPVPGWGSPPSKQLQTNPFIGTKSSSAGVATTGHTSSVNTVPSSHLFQSSTTAFFQPNTVSPIFTKNTFVSTSSSSNSSTTATSNSLVSGNFKAFSTTGNSLQKSAPVTSSAFSQNSSIGQTVSKVFGSSSEGSFSAASLVKNTKVDNVGLFGKPIESKCNLTKTTSSSSSSSSEIPKVLSTSSYEVGLFGKPEKKIEPASEAPIMLVSQPAEVRLFGKQLVPKESETNERTTRKRSVSPKRPWSKPSHSGRHEMESEEGTSSSARASKITPFGRLYSEMDSELKPASSRLFKKNETDNTSDNSLLRRRTLWNKPKIAGDKTSDADQSRPSKRTTFPRQMSEDDESKVALICKNIPSNFNRGAILHKHFSRFGKIARIIPNPPKRSANVHFKDHESAYNAKYEGTVLAPGVRIQIFWHAGTRRTSTSYKDLDAAPSESEVRNLSSTQSKSSKSATVLKKRSWFSNDVEEELQLMAGTNDIKEELVNTLDRPDDIPFILPPPLAPETTATSLSRSSRSYSHRSKTVSGALQSSSTSPEKKIPVSMTEKKMGHMAPPKSTTNLPLRKTESAISTASDVDSAKVSIAAAHVKLLDLYDRAVRKQMKKKSTLASATVLIGTCPDMCPEKERYDREAKRRLHVFEIMAGTENLPYPKADHARVVKEYSRSSADQEEPLLHELRPALVLVRTMTYLLIEIANKGRDGNWPEWYDFLWDRTRGIRKDITQQMMCNVEAVAMIEKCARFHIFSAERLCEEEMSAFSHKINDENLTKCLQSLKYLYADMERKNKVYFETEAEFRAYVVLMNLNEGDMLREVQTLRLDILSSPEIQFALQVYTAINSNNYIKFFKLIRKATFLNACILHRYFAQVRSKALMILMRALSLSSRPVPFPLCKLVETLGFESITQAAAFCRHYGFIVENSDVLLDRASFVEPETAPEPQRSITLVESKCMWTIGEVINGGPLPPHELLTPTTSFDKDGNIKPEMMARNVKEKNETVIDKKVKSEVAVPAEIPSQPFAVTLEAFSSPPSQVEFKPEPQTQYESPSFQEHSSQEQQPSILETMPQKDLTELPKIEEYQCHISRQGLSADPVQIQSEVATIPATKVPTTQSSAMHAAYIKQLTLDMIKELAREMFLEVIGEFATSIAEESVKNVKVLKIIADEIFQQTQCTTVDSLLRELSQQVCEEISLEQHQMLEKMIQEKKLFEEKKKAEAAALQKQKEHEALEAKRLAEVQRRLAEQRERGERTKRVTDEIVQEILETHLEDEMKQISNEEMEQVEKELKEQTIEECSQQEKTDILHKVIDEMCSSVCHEVYAMDMELRLKKLRLKELEYCLCLYRMSKVLQQWKKACIRQEQRRYSLQTFPSCPSLVPVADQLKKLCGPEHSGIVDEALMLNKRARLSIESPICISRRDAYLPAALTLCRLRRHLMQQKAWYPLDIQATVGKELLASSNWEFSDMFNSSINKNESRLYWKLLISFPELDEEADDVYTLSSLELCDWLKSKLTKGALPDSTAEDKLAVLSLYKLQLNEQVNSFSARKMLHLCIRSVTGILDHEDIEYIETEKLFLGTSGLLYILPVMKMPEENEDIDDEEEEIYWLEEHTRLATLLQAKPIKPSLPLTVVMPRHKKLAPLSLNEFIKKMNLQNFIDQELISNVSLFTLPFCLKTPGIDVEHFIAEEKLTGSLKWLASRIPRQPLLEKKRFKDYVEDFLSEEFYGPVLYNQKIRQTEGYLQQSPHMIIDLYNSVIDHLTACATDKELLKYSWPVTEFQISMSCYDLPSTYWNSEDHLIGIGNQLLMLKLPEFVPANELSEKWSKAIEDVWNYIKIIIGDGPDKQAVELVSKVRNLLVRIEMQFSEACLLEFGQEGCLPTAVNVAWLDIIMYCINHLLITTPCLDTSSLEDQECLPEIEVVYRKSALTSYKPDVAWRDAASEMRMREGPTLKSTYIQSVSQMMQNKKSQSTELLKTQIESIKFSLDQDLMAINAKSIDQLKTSLNVEKLHSNNFEDFLERSLQEGFFEEENTFKNFGESEGSTVLDSCAEQSDKSDHWLCDGLAPVNKSTEYEDELSPDFESDHSLEDRITMLKNELESCRKASSFMECCLNSLVVDPFLVEMDTEHGDQDNSHHDRKAIPK